MKRIADMTDAELDAEDAERKRLTQMAARLRRATQVEKERRKSLRSIEARTEQAADREAA